MSRISLEMVLTSAGSSVTPWADASKHLLPRDLLLDAVDVQVVLVEHLEHEAPLLLSDQ